MLLGPGCFFGGAYLFLTQFWRRDVLLTMILEAGGSGTWPHVHVVKEQPAVLWLVGEHLEGREFTVVFWRKCLLMTGAWYQIKGSVLANKESNQTKQSQNTRQPISV